MALFTSMSKPECRRNRGRIPIRDIEGSSRHDDIHVHSNHIGGGLNGRSVKSYDLSGHRCYVELRRQSLRMRVVQIESGVKLISEC